MAVYRPTPTCRYCGKPTAKAIHKDYSDMPRAMRPIGDSFLRWESLHHSCKGTRNAEQKMKEKFNETEWGRNINKFYKDGR